MLRPARLLILGCVLATSPAGAGNELGTSGPFHVIGGRNCGLPLSEQLSGACDPPAADPTLPLQAQSAAEVTRAWKLLSLARVQEARRALDHAIRLDANNAAARGLRGRLALTNGDGNLAETDIDAALVLSPSDPDLLATRAYLLVGRDPEKALRDAEASLGIKPDDPDALWIRSRVLTSLGLLERSYADLTRALEVDPDHSRARELRSEVGLRMGRFREALLDADALLGERPGDPFVVNLHATARAGLGDDAGAVADLTSVLGAPGTPPPEPWGHPVFAQLALHRAMLFVRLRREREAMQDIDAIIAEGGRGAILRLQLFLRRHGFSAVTIDGERSPSLYDALRACFAESGCARGVARGA